MDEPFARLPDHITLRREEVALLLEALEMGLAAAPARAPGRAEQHAAKVLLIAKLWPELGSLLQDPDEEDR